MTAYEITGLIVAVLGILIVYWLANGKPDDRDGWQ